MEKKQRPDKMCHFHNRQELPTQHDKNISVPTKDTPSCYTAQNGGQHLVVYAVLLAATTMVATSQTGTGLLTNILRHTIFGIVTVYLVFAVYEKTSTRSSVVEATAFVSHTRPASVAMNTTNPRLHRVLCFGDSLTAGTSGRQFFPYATYLESKLRSMGRRVQVQHLGMPGWTAPQMLEHLDSNRTGLRRAIRAAQNPGFSLVLLLAGTNDMGRGYGQAETVENILQLHQVNYDSGVPRTVAIAIPPSGYQSVNEPARALAGRINQDLRAFCDTEDRATFVPFPFDFERGGANWFQDTLHLSETGNKGLGESLAPIVEKILQEIDSA
jgi:lysophospholipase L1-like esterase